jgi:hypothetical protein
MTGPKEIHWRPNKELFFIFRYCSHEFRRGLLASCAGTTRFPPKIRNKRITNTDLFAFIGFDLLFWNRWLK